MHGVITDKAFRQHAAATRLLDWSELNVRLFNFHTAGSAYRGPSRLTTASNSSRSEPILVIVTMTVRSSVSHMHVRCVPLYIARSSAHQALLLQIRQFVQAQMDPLGLTKSVGYNYA